MNSTYVAKVVSVSAGEDDLGGRINLKRDVIISASVNLVLVLLVVAENSKGNPGSGGAGHFPPHAPRAAFFQLILSFSYFITLEL